MELKLFLNGPLGDKFEVNFKALKLWNKLRPKLYKSVKFGVEFNTKAEYYSLVGVPSSVTTRAYSQTGLLLEVAKRQFRLNPGVIIYNIDQYSIARLKQHLGYIGVKSLLDQDAIFIQTQSLDQAQKLKDKISPAFADTLLIQDGELL